jgi:hypothetical protein
MGRHVARAKSLLEARTWAEALAINTPTSYERYEQTFPSGPHAREARTRIIDLVWEQSRDSCLLRSAQAYVGHHRGTPNGETARARLENLIWNLSTNANTIRSLRAYASHYPEGRFLAEANTRQATLITNEAVYLTTLSQGSAEAFLRFLREYPGHDKEWEAKQSLINVLESQNADVFASGEAERF